jgi:hypothetical protein
MIQPRKTKLVFAPSGEFILASIVELTPAMIDEQFSRRWWLDDALEDRLDIPPIDLHWNWNEIEIVYDGRRLASQKVAIVAGPDESVQGAMMISTDPVESVLHPGEKALFVELLFTAPWNRPQLRKDRKPFVRNVGTELLTWGAWFSRESGYGGRLLLDGSPDFVVWYEQRGFRRLGTEMVSHEGVEYTPMELPVLAAQSLLNFWREA